MPHPTPASRARFVAGDPLRGLASLSVMVLHAAAGAAVVIGVADGDNPRLLGTVPGHLVDLARMAVPVFFILSGYLVGRPFVAAFAAGGGGRMDLPAYAWRRIVRIVPAFWVVAIIAILLYGDGSTPGQALSVLFFVQVFDPSPAAGAMVHGWTLDAEAFFYVLLPVLTVGLAAGVGRLADARVRTVLALGAVVGVVAVGWIAAYDGFDAGTTVATPWGLLRVFLPGIALAVADVAWGERLAGWRGGPRAAGLVAAAAIALWLLTNVTSTRGNVELVVATGLVAAPWLLERTGGTPWRLLDNRLLQWLGQRSYGMYLVHWPVLLFLRPHLEGLGSREAFAAFLVLDVLLSVALAAVLWRVVEEPALRLRHLFDRKRRTARAKTKNHREALKTAT